MYCKKNLYGFTLIEIVVVITIILVISGFGMVNYSSFIREQRVEQGIEEFLSVLTMAKEYAQNKENLDLACSEMYGYRVATQSDNRTYDLAICCDPTCTDDQTVLHTYTLAQGLEFREEYSVSFPSEDIERAETPPPIIIQSNLNTCIAISISRVLVINKETLQSCPS